MNASSVFVVCFLLVAIGLQLAESGQGAVFPLSDEGTMGDLEADDVPELLDDVQIVSTSSKSLRDILGLVNRKKVHEGEFAGGEEALTDLSPTQIVVVGASDTQNDAGAEIQPMNDYYRNNPCRHHHYRRLHYRYCYRY